MLGRERVGYFPTLVSVSPCQKTDVYFLTRGGGLVGPEDSQLFPYSWLGIPGVEIPLDIFPTLG